MAPVEILAVRAGPTLATIVIVECVTTTLPIVILKYLLFIL